MRNGMFMCLLFEKLVDATLHFDNEVLIALQVGFVLCKDAVGSGMLVVLWRGELVGAKIRY